MGYRCQFRPRSGPRCDPVDEARIEQREIRDSPARFSDEPLSSETNYRTEFVAVLNNQPQGGFITRAPSPSSTRFAHTNDDTGGFFGHFGCWFGSSGNPPPPPPGRPPVSGVSYYPYPR
jgi:hypothetical protein